MKRESVIIYRSFYESIKLLPENNQIEVWSAIFQFSFYGKNIELSETSKGFFILIKPQLLANNQRYINGVKGGKFGVLGGRPKKPQRNPKETPNANANVNANVNDNVNDNVNANVNVNAIKTRFEKFKISLLTQQIFLEDICMKAEIKISEVPQALDNFIVHAIAGGENHLTQKEFATHFRNLCLKIKSAIIKHTHTPHYSQW